MDFAKPLEPITGEPKDIFLITYEYRPFILLDLDKTTRIAFTVLLALAWLLAMAGKFTIFKMLWQTGFSDRPINVLILFDQILDVITRSVHLPTIVVLVTNKPLAYLIGSSLCPIFVVTVFGGFAFRSLGSLGIAIFRIIYVKGHGIVAGNRYMEWTICIILIASNVGGSLILLCLYLMVTSPRSYLKEMCYGYNSEFLMILLEYTGAVTQTWIHKILIGILASSQLVIAVLYSILFRHIYKHDQTMTKVLSEQAIKNRNKRNAISSACEMYGYGVELLMYLFFIFTASADRFASLRPHVMIFWQIEFAIKSTVQVMAGSDTRAIFLKIIRRADILRIELIVSKVVQFLRTHH